MEKKRQLDISICHCHQVIIAVVTTLNLKLVKIMFWRTQFLYHFIIVSLEHKYGINLYTFKMFFCL